MTGVKLLKWIFILIGIAYFIAPVDLIPDFAGLLGRLDDLLILAFLYYRWRLLFSRAREGVDSRSESNGEKGQQPLRQETDPYKVLGLSKGASPAEIRSAYTTLASQYHPDKVSHLGPELQKVANDKMIQIQSAYEALK